MILRGILFGRCFNASGTQGFFGEGYPFHPLWKRVGLTFHGCTFVAKTTTLKPRLDPANKQGNMPLRKDGITPKELMPKCIVVKPLKGVVLNAVGLSGPGAHSLLERNLWQRRTQPFLLSFMSVQPSIEERLGELEEFVYLLAARLPQFKAPVGLEINFSCPNVGLHTEDLLGEVLLSLGKASSLGIPLIPKVNALLPPEVACQIASHPACDAICCSNTIPWGQLPDLIDWKGLFGRSESPLKQFGGGGLSGAPLLPIVKNWVSSVRTLGMTKPINAGGGILSAEDAFCLRQCGADAVSLGVIAILRPWNMRPTIRATNRPLYVEDKKM